MSCPSKEQGLYERVEQVVVRHRYVKMSLLDRLQRRQCPKLRLGSEEPTTGTQLPSRSHHTGFLFCSLTSS